MFGAASSDAAAKKKNEARTPAVPPYKITGTIPGTALSYEKLLISEDGSVSVNVRNPERTGVRFRATFSFYSAKNELLTGFKIEGTAVAGAVTGYSLKLPNHKKMKDVSYMTVLGRSGRSGGDDWE
ncbi:MAG: hypothetical protein LBS45_09065 [Synergistaceae bacterium]|jgi:hypothetical protein|nr:hypothetical protein [Synergistaceae bacterium]